MPLKYLPNMPVRRNPTHPYLFSVAHPTFSSGQTKDKYRRIYFFFSEESDMNDSDFKPAWLKLFEPGNEFFLRWLTAAQRRDLEAQMMADYDAYVRKQFGEE
ncbi:hypothetical protein [Defluviicoccus vanus]|uniref:Uncharacterized protein n=1 Tax=Defluviicoccus vanus TaxID=111831 RepID=A0A7H1MZG1_9PROT|nr:hypothetical protein [Defluviicoccus vanus]QNT68847.1 hypothetical protein HQ394_05115 [Defluviicoccus vanus]